MNVLDMLADKDPPAAEIVNATATAPILLVCDHASRRLPTGIRDGGLSEADLTRHIAWDIGAAEVTRHMARQLNATAVLSTYSRLVIDCNRHLHDPTLMINVSDGTAIPFNAAISAAERRARIDTFYRPYHDAIAGQLARLVRHAPVPVMLSIHSCTPRLDGRDRPWHIGVCWERDRRLAGPVMANLRRCADVIVGDNEPYALKSDEDYSVPWHATRHGWPHLQVEIRQDLIDNPAGTERYAGILLGALRDPLGDPGLYRAEFQ